MIHAIADGAAGAFFLTAVWTDGVRERFAWAGVAAALAVSNALNGPNDYGWAGFCGAGAVALVVSAVADWAKARRRKRGAE